MKGDEASWLKKVLKKKSSLLLKSEGKRDAHTVLMF